MNVDKRLLGEARAAQSVLLLAIGAGLLAGVATVAQARFLSSVVAQVFLGGRSLAEVEAPLAALLAAILARAACIWARELLAARAAIRVKAWLRERFFAHVLALGPAYAWGESTGELATTATEGIEALDAYFAQYLPNLALAALIPFAILLFVFPLDLVSGLVLLLTAPLLPLFVILIGKLADVLAKRQFESLSRLSAHFLDVLQGLATLKAFGRSRAQVEIVAQMTDRFRRTTMGVLSVAFLSALVLEMVGTISTAIVAVGVGLRLLYGTLAFEQAFFVLVLAPEFYLPLRALGTSFHAGMAGVAAAQRLFAVLETPVEGEPMRTVKGRPNLLSRDRPSPLTPFPAREGGTRQPGSVVETSFSPPPAREGPGVRSVPSRIFPLVFADVHYVYPDGRVALEGVSFTVEAGEKVALVGPSGTGKSTVANLLLRFVEPTAGEILVNGLPLRALPPAEWRRQVAWVPQNPYLFNATVAENIRLARPDADPAAVAHAAALAHADEFIRALPDGYDTVVSERGGRLSGGQAQRLALARAFLAAAPLLLLDEATANLDPEQEALVGQSLDELLACHAAIQIAHRLNTVRRADKIVVLAGGRVAEVGTHQALLHRGGLYRRLVAAYGGMS